MNEFFLCGCLDIWQVNAERRDLNFSLWSYFYLWSYWLTVCLEVCQQCLDFFWIFLVQVHFFLDPVTICCDCRGWRGFWFSDCDFGWTGSDCLVIIGDIISISLRLLYLSPSEPLEVWHKTNLSSLIPFKFLKAIYLISILLSTYQ